MSTIYAILCLCGAALATPALAKPDAIRVLNGVPIYEGDPGLVEPAKAPPGSPDMHLVIDETGASIHFNTLYGDHQGAENCVLRQRVVFDAWDRDHPYVRVCRKRG